MLRSFLGIILALCFAAVGSGVPEYVHNLEHAREDALESAAAREQGKPDPVQPIHDDSNCSVHAQLHIPLLSGGCVPVLVLLGVFVTLLTVPHTPLISQRIPSRIDCRGPPTI